jgi:UDP-N-acetylmuramoylalanine--D-glutamate ligase
MKAAIVGYRLEGQISATYWQKLGYDVVVRDADESVKDDTPGLTWQLGPDYLKNLGDFDVIVRTAGLHPQKILDANPDQPDLADKITSSVNEFFAKVPTKNIIGVTGTKGKGTTSTLIHLMLQAAELPSHLGGNIGIPPLQLLPQVQEDDWVVLELSSFQLSDINYSPHIGVCLMVVPEHLDWHASVDEYVESKQRMFLRQTREDAAVFNAHSELARRVVNVTVAQEYAYDVPVEGIRAEEKSAAYVDFGTIFYKDTRICEINKVGLIGRHNLENICAAISAAWLATDGDINAIQSVIYSFKGLEHRIELVRSWHGVRYYDDSFATTPETSIAAIKAFDQPKVMILGGSDKGVPFDALAKEVAHGNVKFAVVIGDTAPVITTLLQKNGFTNFGTGYKTMAEIVQAASSHAELGDVVLLSTGAASFDMFIDYKDRGEQFKQAVLALA